MTGAFPHLAQPAWLATLAVLPLLAAWHHRRAALGALTFSRLPAGGGGAWRLHLPFYARLGALALLVVALARPQLGYAWEENLTEGIDIVVALDVSGSMGAEDLGPDNRLTVAKRVVRDFVAGRPGDRIGLVVFSGTALTRSPLTSDLRMLDRLVDSLELNSLPGGTAIGVALASSAARLRDSEAKSRVIVLVTDGANNAGEIDPLSAAAVARGLGLKIYPIGVGTAGRVALPVRERDARTGRVRTRWVVMNDQLDEELLATLAERTGGRAFRAADAGSLARVFAEIDRLEKTERVIRRSVRYREVFQPFAGLALALLVAPLLAAAAGATAEG